MNEHHIMLDLELMSTESNAAIVAIGACEFFPETGLIGSEFYMNVNLQTCLNAGMHISPSTIAWWLKQSDEARSALQLEGGVSISTALMHFRDFCSRLGEGNLIVWGCGSDFDNVILGNAFKTYAGDPPWKFWNNRCYRTLKSLRPDIPFERIGVHHNALDDAISQAKHASKILQALKG